MDTEHYNYLAEIGDLREKTNAVFYGHDGNAIVALCAEYIAKWVMAHHRHARKPAFDHHVDLVMQLIGVAAEVLGDGDPFGEDDIDANLKH